jgi:iron complex outermembrane receptor protein
LLFAQAEFVLPADFFVTVGVSYNYYKIDYARLSDVPAFLEEKKFDPEISPRLAVLKKINRLVSVYGSISKGFSPPSVGELYPSTATFNSDLEAESGINYEVGSRGVFLDRKLNVDVTLYSFQLQDAIVIRRTTDGADYFVNAGGTSQKGLEFYVSWEPIVNGNTLSDFRLWSSYTLNDYHFKDYVQDVNDYSGNPVTGVAPNIFLAGFDLSVLKTFYLNVTYTFTDEIPLDDASTAYADSYILLNTRLGYHFTGARLFSFDVFAGADNLFDERYSLGNDLNAFGGRYYNTAAPRNYYFGVRMRIKS